MSLAEVAQKLAALGKHNRQRHAVHISGDAEQCLKTASELCAGLIGKRCILYDASQQTSINSILTFNHRKAARRYLGSELDAVIVNGHNLFDPDAVGILSGCLRAGGIMIFLTPCLDGWPNLGKALPDDANHKPSVYLSRAARVLANCQSTFKLSIDGAIKPDISTLSLPSAPDIDYSEQRSAIESVKAMFSDSCVGPVVLESDRGRGKSAALGIAARELIETQGHKIAVTSHGRRSTDALFAHALENSDIVGENIRYISPHDLIGNRQNIDLLLIDEAASLPLSMLKRLLNTYPHIALASTVHGYEGTGKGFSIKFHEILGKCRPTWQLIKLEEPIRWSRNDPLESLINRLLMLDAEPAVAHAARATDSRPRFIEYDQARLVNDEDRLRNLFAILARAHYRTTPSDLARILDGRNLRLFGLENHHGDTLSVALTAIEGCLSEELSKDIRINQRRPLNHLLPVALSTQLGFHRALSMRCARVVRIAVNPKLVGHSFGKQLISQLIRCLTAKYDLIGASFGLDEALHGFWRDCGFSLVRIGVKKNRSTGTHSGLVIRGLSKHGIELARDAKRQFFRNLASQIPLYFHDMDSGLLNSVGGNGSSIGSSASLNLRDVEELQAFAAGHCNPDRVAAALRLFAESTLASDVSDLEEIDREILHQRLILCRPWSTIRRCLPLSKPISKREGLACLRGIVSGHLDQFMDIV